MRVLQKQEGKVSVIHHGVNVCSEHSVDQQLKNLSISAVNSCWMSLVFLEYFWKEQKCCLNGNSCCPMQDIAPLHEAFVSNVYLPGV